MQACNPFLIQFWHYYILNEEILSSNFNRSLKVYCH
uniref:Uncharacterized protein n=1 Tax=Arundo donax TaxID=35708 RepID=A0A0A9AZY8_ARUDO